VPVANFWRKVVPKEKPSKHQRIENKRQATEAAIKSGNLPPWEQRKLQREAAKNAREAHWRIADEESAAQLAAERQAEKDKRLLVHAARWASRYLLEAHGEFEAPL